jgi:hypothetical protein
MGWNREKEEGFYSSRIGAMKEDLYAPPILKYLWTYLIILIRYYFIILQHPQYKLILNPYGLADLPEASSQTNFFFSC